MLHKTSLFTVVLSLGAVIAANAQKPALTAAEIVSKNVEARGGSQAWHGVQTLSFKGQMQAGGGDRPTVTKDPHKGDRVVTKPATGKQVELPFLLELKRGHKARVEIVFAGKTAVQIYDGAHGYKYRPFLNRTDYEPYTEEEAKVALEQPDLDGPLVDSTAKGTKVEFVGTEKVENRDTYKLKLTMKDGHTQNVWIDAQTFLETKVEGTPRRLDGKYRPVEIFYRDYRKVNGIMLPFVLETHVAEGIGPKGTRAAAMTEKISVTEASVNPKLDDALFVKPSGAPVSPSPRVVKSATSRP